MPLQHALVCHLFYRRHRWRGLDNGSDQMVAGCKRRGIVLIAEQRGHNIRVKAYLIAGHAQRRDLAPDCVISSAVHVAQRLGAQLSGAHDRQLWHI